MARLVKISGEAMQAGISPSLPNDEGLVWRYSMNAVFAERSIQPSLGQDLIIVGEGKRPSDILTTRVDRRPTLFMGIEDELLMWDEVNGGAKVGSGLDPAGDWVLEAWGNHVLGTNGIDPVQYWTGGQFGDLAGCPYTSELLVRRGPFVVLLNTSEGGTHIAWCDEDDLSEWDPRPDTMAGDLFVRDVASDIIAALPMGDEIVFYTTDSIHRLAFQGAPYIFGERKISEGVGPVGKHAVCEQGRTHYGFSRKGLFITSGLDYKFIDKDLVHDWVFDDLSDDEDILARTVVYNDEVEELIFFFFPSNGGLCNDRCIAYSYRYNNWQPMSLMREAAENVSAFPYGITADAFGNVFYQQTKSLLTNQNVVPMRMQGYGGVRYGFGGGGFGLGPFGGTLGLANASSKTVVLPRGDATVLVNDNQTSAKAFRVTTLASPNEQIYVESKDFDFGSDGLKLIDKVKFQIGNKHSGDSEASGVNPGEVFFYLGGRNELCDEHVWKGPYDMVNCSDDCLSLEAVWFRLKIIATAPQTRWKLSAITLSGSITTQEAPSCQTDQSIGSAESELSPSSKKRLKTTYDLVDLSDWKF